MAEEDATPQAESSEGAISRESWQGFTWRAENVVPLLLVVGGAVSVWVTLGYPMKARVVPLALTIGMIVLSATELFRQWFLMRAAPAQIMDLGMRSSGMKGATRAGILLAELSALFLFLAMTVRLDNAAIAFAVLVPVLFLPGRGRWLTAAITGGIILAWTYGFMSYFMAVIWPEPVLSNWLFGPIWSQ